MTTYSMEIANAVRDYLDSENLHYIFQEEDGQFYFPMTSRSRFGNVHYVISVEDTFYCVTCVLPLSANVKDKNECTRVNEFITRANYGLIFGCFEMDYRDGELRFRLTVDCKNGLPVPKQIEHSIFSPAAMCSRYGGGIAEIMFFDTAPADAVEVCEDSDFDDIAANLKALRRKNLKEGEIEE